MERTEIDAVRRMPLADFLARLGYEPVRRSGNELWYIAPYRGERTPSFRVNVAKQLWYDFGLGKGGDIFTLAGEFLQSDDFMKQAKFIAEAANMTVAGWEKPVYLSKPTESVFEDVEVAPLLRSLLTEYLEERGIPYAIASRHCCRLNYGVRGKRYFAVGFPNMAGGYEVRSRYFKGCIPPKSISLVKANDIPADECLVFEGFTDFLSAVTLGVTGNADCLVLNSIANVEKAAGLLEGYGRIGCFLDRDEAGRRTLDALTKRYGERVTDRSSLYDDCKDLNEYLQQTMKKQKNNHLKIEEQPSKNRRTMNILNNRNKRTSILKAVALCLIAVVSFTLVSCDDDMDIQQSYPFTVEVMPVPNKVTKGQTVEIRCELKKEGDFAGTLYTIRYFQFEGEGKLKMDNGITFLPNDRYLLENGKFRLYYTAEGDEAHNFIVVVEDNFGNSFELEFDFNNRNVKDDGLTIVPISNFRPLLK